MSKQIVAIGDIHGCVKTLKALWSKLEPFEDALHIFVGDYIDRGPSSKQVVDFLLNVRHEKECVFLRGNHEEMLLEALNNKNTKNWLYNGGDATMQSYNDASKVADLPESHLNFYKETKLYHETDDYFFVHAGVPPHQTISESLKENASNPFFLWGREHLNAFEVPWEKTIIFGHTPRPYPIQKDKMIGIDTGCVYSELGYGKLTAVVLPDKTFIHESLND